MSVKNESVQETLRKRIYEYYSDHESKGKKFTVDHFETEHVPKSTTYSIIARAENDFSHQRAIGSGRIPQIMTKKGVKRLGKMFNHKSSVSQSQAARKFACSKQFVSKTLKNKTSIRFRKKKVIPNRTEVQKINARTRCGRLYAKFQKNLCIMDDESYFTLSHSTINGNRSFYSSDVAQTPADQKYRTKAKFEKKLLVWLCFSERGLSQPYFVPSGMAINQITYLNECIIKRLVPFIEEHHPDGEYIFWPDLASSHYAKTVISYLEAKKLNFVEKQDNPPNVPECRPIEDFWSILKGMVYEGNWQAKTLIQLRRRIEYCMKKVDLDLIYRLSKSIPGRLNKIRMNGVIETNKNTF